MSRPKFSKGRKHDVKQRGDGRWALPALLARVGALAPMLATVMMAGACGDQSDPGDEVASLSSSASSSQPKATASGDALAYAKCMRENGLADFPDPQPGGGLGLPEGIDPESDRFKAAEAKCKKYVPGDPNVRNGGDAQSWSSETKLKYAKCMRDNGLPKFPDPDSSGGFVFLQGSGIDPQSNLFKKAEQACARYKAPNMPQNPAAGDGK